MTTRTPKQIRATIALGPSYARLLLDDENRTGRDGVDGEIYSLALPTAALSTYAQHDVDVAAAALNDR